jgi:hypothetical protein
MEAYSFPVPARPTHRLHQTVELVSRKALAAGDSLLHAPDRSLRIGNNFSLYTTNQAPHGGLFSSGSQGFHPPATSDG